MRCIEYLLYWSTSTFIHPSANHSINLFLHRSALLPSSLHSFPSLYSFIHEFLPSFIHPSAFFCCHLSIHNCPFNYTEHHPLCCSKSWVRFNFFTGWSCVHPLLRNTLTVWTLPNPFIYLPVFYQFIQPSSHQSVNLSIQPSYLIYQSVRTYIHPVTVNPFVNFLHNL